MFAPSAPPAASLPDFDLDAALSLVQGGLDQTLFWPRWTALLFIAFAIALTMLGRHGQRLLAGTSLGGIVAGAILLGLRPHFPDAEWPGFLAVLGGGAALGLGIATPGWTTAIVSATALCAVGMFLAVRIAHVSLLVGAIPGALLGLFLGLANHLFWGLWMPPIAAAFSLSIAAARLLGAADTGPIVSELAQAPYSLALFVGLSIALIVVSHEREHRKRLRAAARTQAMSDRELQSKVKRERERHERFLGNSGES